MALSERERGRLRNVMDTVMRADDVVMDIAGARAVNGPTPEDDNLDALHDALAEALDRLEKLLGRG